MNGANPNNTDKNDGKSAIRQAVALKYNPDEQQAPSVAAKGKGRIAEEIVKKAEEAGVPIQQDASLVEVLSRLDLNQEIPAELYMVVAEILSFVYRSDQRIRLEDKL